MKYLIYILCLLSTLPTMAQHTFSTTIGQQHRQVLENGCNVFSLSDTTYIIANNYLDSLGINKLNLIKIDGQGHILWEKNHRVTSGAVIFTCIGELIHTKDGGFAFGSFKYQNASYGEEAFLMKFNSTGGLLWQKRYGNKEQHERTLALQQFEDGGYVLSGFSFPSDFDSTTIYIVRTDVSGKKLWEKYISAPKEKDKDYMRSLSVDVNLDGEIVIGGLMAEVNFNDSDGTHLEDGIVLKLDSLGNEIWRKYYETRDELNDCDTYIKTLPTGGGYIVWGCERYAISPSSEFVVDSYFIQQLTEEGDTVWTTFLDDGSRENGGTKEIENIHFLEDGHLLIIGTNTVQPNAAPRFGYLAKCTSNGDLIWERTFDFYGESLPVSNDNFFYDVALTPDGGFMVSGRITFYGEPALSGTRTQVWLLRLDSMGCLYPDCTDKPIVVDIEEVLVEELEGGLKIVPNPSKGMANVYWTPQETEIPAQIQIFDLTGRQVFNAVVNANSGQANLPTTIAKNGIYVCVLKIDNHISYQTKWVVVQ
ncbi:MAG: T9SS type A sorting domain-containing protein [Chitinophagales bacterium]